MWWVPCNARGQVSCEESSAIAVSSLSAAASIVMFFSATLTPLHLYYVRHDLQIRQQHWCRMALIFSKCMLVAGSVLLPAHEVPINFTILYSVVCNGVMVSISYCGGPSATGSLVAPNIWNSWRTLTFATAVWSSCCLVLTGAGDGRDWLQQIAGRDYRADPTAATGIADGSGSGFGHDTAPVRSVWDAILPRAAVGWLLIVTIFVLWQVYLKYSRKRVKKSAELYGILQQL